VILYRKLQLSLIVKGLPFLHVNCHFHGSPPLIPVQTKINIDPTCHNISFFKPILILPSHSRLVPDVGPLPYGLQTINKISGVNYMDRYFSLLIYSKWTNQYKYSTYVLISVLPAYWTHEASKTLWSWKRWVPETHITSLTNFCK